MKGIDVDYTLISGDYDAAMLARFAAKRPPDVFYVDPLDADYQPGLEPLNKYIEKTRVVDEAVLPTPAQWLHRQGEDLRLPEGLVAARADRNARCSRMQVSRHVAATGPAHADDVAPQDDNCSTGRRAACLP